MLNELLVIERGMASAGIRIEARHPDIQEATRGAKPLHIWLDPNGEVADLSPVAEKKIWTIRSGNKNSFPFIQVGKSVLDDAAMRQWKEWVSANRKAREDQTRHALIEIASNAKLRAECTGRAGMIGEWATKSVLGKLRERMVQLSSLSQTDAAALVAALERFLKAFESHDGASAARFSQSLRSQLVAKLAQASTQGLLGCAAALLVTGKGSICVDASGEWPYPTTNRFLIPAVTEALNRNGKRKVLEGRCALTGSMSRLIDDTFPRSHLQAVGPTIIFSRFKERHANERYARFGAETMSVSDDVARRLAAAVEELTSDERRGLTWRELPRDGGPGNDLLLAFVEEVPDAPIVDNLAADQGFDFSDECSASDNQITSVAAFEKRTERVISAVSARVGGDFKKTPVNIAIFRRLDQANRKVLYSGRPSIGDVYDAAINWAQGEKNVPSWLSLLGYQRGVSSRRMPPHLAPLGTIGFSKKLFLRSGMCANGKKKEYTGISAGEAFALFLECAATAGASGRGRVRRILRLVLGRRGPLMIGAVHAQRRGDKSYTKFDGWEALRSVTFLGILLYKLNRKSEEYMTDTAFKLGQLLAAADVVHAGYCADVRGGDLPPSLLGNQVFGIAQRSPGKALAMLCRRWKPYGAWARRMGDHTIPERFLSNGRWKSESDLTAGRERDEFKREKAIVTAVSYAWRVAAIAQELKGQVGRQCDDQFRAELLLGYIAGIPRKQEAE